MNSLGFAAHDHHACIHDSLARAEQHCAQHKVQLTPVRRRVLEILLQEHRALGAYDILDRLRSEGLGSQPPVAYRALDFLVKHGFVHRIERLNAFVACGQSSQDHTPGFLICSQCSAVAEIDVSPAIGPFEAAAQGLGFALGRVVHEAEGICPNCRKDAPA